MNGTRFARSGRCRFFISLGALVLMFVMIAIFHSSQQQLDESREQRIRCEQQQDSLNIRLQAIVEQKYNIEKTLERERKEQMEKNKNLEQTVKLQKEQMLKEKTESGVRSEKLQQNLKHLQTEHNQLVGECSKNNRKHTEELNVFEKKLALANSELQKERSTSNDSISQWKEKVASVLREKEQFEVLNNDLKQRITALENIVNEYKSNCDHKIKGEVDLQQQIIKPASANALISHGASSSDRPAFQKPLNVKTFSEQESVSPDLYRILLKTNKPLDALTAEAPLTEQVSTNNTNNLPLELSSSALKSTSVDARNISSINVGKASLNDKFQLSLPFSALNNHSQIIKSVENFQIVPNAIKKPDESEVKNKKKKDISGKIISQPLGQATEHYNKKLNMPDVVDKKMNSTISNAIKTVSASVPSLNQRQLPDNVAPIPENFDDLPKNEPIEKGADKHLKSEGYGADIDAAVEDLQKNDNDNAHYGNPVNDLEQKMKLGVAANEDSGAHEIKDINDRNLNLQPKENFFEHEGKIDAAADFNKHYDNDDDDDMLGAAIVGGVGVGEHNDSKNRNILEAEGLNNEVLRDQGKEFPDGIHIEDGNEEDEDEDDYSNPALRKKGAQAIRN